MAIPLNEYKFWRDMDENKLFNLMKNYHTDIINFNDKDEFSPIDWYIPSLDAHIEVKCRNESFNQYLIEKEKWDALIKVDKGWYMNSTPTEKLIYWDVKTIDEPVWFYKKCKKTTQFGPVEYVNKLVGYLYPIEKMGCHQFHYHLLY